MRQKPILSTLLYNVHVYCIMYTEYKIPFSFIFKMVFSIFNNLTRFYFASAKLHRGGGGYGADDVIVSPDIGLERFVFLASITNRAFGLLW